MRKIPSCRWFDDQSDVDYFWKKFPGGGKTVRCGWLTDKYSLSWRIVPTILADLMDAKDAAGSRRVVDAMLKVVKLDITKRKQACGGKGRSGRTWARRPRK